MIVWERNPGSMGSGLNGYIPETVSGRIKIATIAYSLTRDDPEPWKLHCDIPGWAKPRSFATQDEAKSSARRILATFVRYATAALATSERESGE